MQSRQALKIEFIKSSDHWTNLRTNELSKLVCKPLRNKDFASIIKKTLGQNMTHRKKWLEDPGQQSQQ